MNKPYPRRTTFLHNITIKGDVALVKKRLVHNPEELFELDQVHPPLKALQYHIKLTFYKYGNTPLHHACLFGRLELVEIFLKHGSSVFDVNLDGNTPLHKAAVGGHTQVAKALINANCNIMARNNAGFSAVELASRRKHTECSKYLSSTEISAVLNYKIDDNGNTSLHYAVSSGNINILAAVLRRGPNIERRNGDENTALHIAAIEGQFDIFEKLLNAGADLFAFNGEGYTVYDLALWNNHVRLKNNILRLEKQKLVDMGVEDDLEGNTALHIACSIGRENLVNLILDRYPRLLNSKSNSGSFPLHKAAKHGRRAIAIQLIERRANVLTKSYEGYRSSDLAEWEGHSELAKTLYDIEQRAVRDVVLYSIENLLQSVSQDLEYRAEVRRFMAIEMTEDILDAGFECATEKIDRARDVVNLTWF